MRLARFVRAGFFACAGLFAAVPASGAAVTALLPDGRTITPEGFTIPVESFASAQALSPDGRYLAVLSQDAGAVDVLAIDGEHSELLDRLRAPSATGLAWTTDGLFVTRGYSGAIARFNYDPGKGKKGVAGFALEPEFATLGPGLVNGIAEDPATHRIVVARTANHEVVTLDARTGAVVARRRTSAEPFAVALAGGVTFASLYNSDRVATWRGNDANGKEIVTGPHPTAMLADGSRLYVADADGHDVVAIDTGSLAIARRYDLALAPGQPPGQTPSGMALSADRGTLFVAESGFNDVAVVDLGSGRVRGRIPTAWYPMAIAAIERPTGEKDGRIKQQLWIANAQGLGSQPDPGGEWNGTYTGLVQHLVVEPERLAAWSDQVARNDRFATQPAATALPPIKHVLFVVRENKQFDEEFGDEPGADGDPGLVVYGKRFTPNAHALAARYTLFDNFYGNGEASIYGHAWTTQGMTNDYQERNAHSADESGGTIDARVPWCIWPYPQAGEDTVTQATLDFDWFRDLTDLPGGPRINVSGVFGPRGELIDALQRKGVSFRVYGEQMTMLPNGRIAPGLAEHAARAYPGAHIDYNVLDTERASLFLADVRAHGLPQYAYLTLPTDHTAGTKPGFYTPASYVASNDVALGQIVAGLSHLKEWRDTVVFVTTDDPQGTGDHVDAHRQPALAIGPWVRRGVVDHTHYSIPSILRTVEALYGVEPLNIYDAAATPMADAFAQQPDDGAFSDVPANIAMERNPGKAASLVEPLDGPDDATIAREEWQSVRGSAPPTALARAGD